MSEEIFGYYTIRKCEIFGIFTTKIGSGSCILGTTGIFWHRLRPCVPTQRSDWGGRLRLSEFIEQTAPSVDTGRNAT